MSSTHPPRGYILLMAVVFEGGLVVLWLILARALKMPPASQGTVTPEALALGAAATVPLLPLMVWLSRSRFGPFRRLMAEVDKVLVPFLSRLTLADFALVSLLAGFGEEGLFRGIIQGGISSVMPPLAALVITSVLFGLLHFITPAYALLAGGIGLYLGWLFLATGNLVVPVVVHVLYDFFALVYIVRVRRKDPKGDDRESP